MLRAEFQMYLVLSLCSCYIQCLGSSVNNRETDLNHSSELCIDRHQLHFSSLNP